MHQQPKATEYLHLYLGRQDRYFWLTAAASVVALTCFVIWCLSDPVSMHYWAKEDGLFENATAALYVLAGCIFLATAYRADFIESGGSRLGRGFLIIWAVGSFFIAGEEISWGQRMFNIETPEAFAAVNYQQEINFHNLDVFAVMAEVLPVAPQAIFMGTVGALFPLIAVSRQGRKMFQRYQFPIMPGVYAILIIGSGFYGKLLRADSPFPKDPTEIREFLWAISIFLFAVHAYVRPWEVYRLAKPTSGDTSP